MLHAWKQETFSPTLAKEQLQPLSDTLSSLGVPVQYVRGNTDDEAGQAADTQVIRDAFNDPQGKKIDIKFPGWTYRDDNTLFVHGHAFDLSSLRLNMLVALEAFPFLLHMSRKHRYLFQKVLFSPSQSSEMTLSLRQALRGQYQDLLFLANRSNERHGKSTTLYRMIRKIPILRSFVEAMKTDVAEYSVHGTALRAVSQHNASLEHPIERVVLSHTHIPAFWDAERMHEEGLAEDAPNMPQAIVNTGTVGGRTMKGVSTALTLRDGEQPKLLKLYDPENPRKGILPLKKAL